MARALEAPRTSACLRQNVIRDIWRNLHSSTCGAATRRSFSDPAFPFAVGFCGPTMQPWC